MDHQRRGRCRLAALVAATFCLVAAHEGRCGAAARPLTRRLHAVEEAVLDVGDAEAEAPEAAARWPGGGDALGESKWLPMSAMPVSVQVPAAASALASGLRFPPVVFPLGGVPMSMPWLPIPGAAPHAFAGTGGPVGGGLPALVPPYVGATRQEQLSLWASLFNPLQVRPRLPISFGGGGGGDTTAGPGVPAAIASSGKAAEGETVDVPAAGAGAVHVADVAPKWGVFLGNIDHRN